MAIIPNKMTVKLRIRLMNQNTLILTAEVLGENDDEGRAIAVGSLATVALRGLSSRRAMWVRRLTTSSFGSGCRFLYDSTINVVTKPENRPAYIIELEKIHQIR